MHKSSQSRVTMPNIKSDTHTHTKFSNKNPWKALGLVCQFQGTEGVTRVLAPRLSPRKSPKRGRAAGTGALGPKRPSWMTTLIGSSRKLLSDISESQASQRCVAELCLFIEETTASFGLESIQKLLAVAVVGRPYAFSLPSF